MNVLVVGAGDMGTWAGGSFDADVAFADAEPSTARAAATATDGRTVPLDTDERFDAVCLAVPLPSIAEAIATHADRAERALLDVSGAMEPAVSAMRDHAPDRERVSLHPLFAPDAAPGRVAVVADAPGPLTDELRAGLAARGNDLFETTPAEHDRAMRTVQARAHAAVLAYGLAAEPVREEFQTPVSRALSELVERVTGGRSHVYADIQATFDGAEDVAGAARRVAEADGDAFDALYREAGGRSADEPDGGGG
jgi:prephenate dehydrogenase